MDLARQLGPAEEGREPRGLALQTASFDSEEEVLYAPGTQTTRVSGEVVRWHLVNGAEAIPAADYIQAWRQRSTPASLAHSCVPPPRILHSCQQIPPALGERFRVATHRLVPLRIGMSCSAGRPSVCLPCAVVGG